MNRKIVRQRRVSRAPVVILLLLILILVGIIAVLFSFYVIDDLNTDPMDKVNFTPLAVSDEDTSSSVTPGGILAAAVASRSAATSSSLPASSEGEVKTKRVQVKTLVPESPPADKSYFDDSLFIGDSVTLGFRNSSFIPAKNIVAAQNVNLNEIVANIACYQGMTKTLYQMIDSQMPNPKKIYILLGLNNLPGTSNSDSMNYYGKMLDDLKDKFPDAMIYVESLTPMTQNSQYAKRFTHDKINDFNDRLAALAAEKGVYYLNLQEVLKDANGYLIQDYASTDGLHLVKKGHEAMYNYFRTHTVQPDGYTDQILK